MTCLVRRHECLSDHGTPQGGETAPTNRCMVWWDSGALPVWVWHFDPFEGVWTVARRAEAQLRRQSPCDDAAKHGIARHQKCSSHAAAAAAPQAAWGSSTLWGRINETSQLHRLVAGPQDLHTVSLWHLCSGDRGDRTCLR